MFFDLILKPGFGASHHCAQHAKAECAGQFLLFLQPSHCVEIPPMRLSEEMGICGPKILLLPLPFHDQREKDWKKSLFLTLESLYFPYPYSKPWSGSLLALCISLLKWNPSLTSKAFAISLEGHPSCSSPDFPPLPCRHHNCPLLFPCTERVTLDTFQSYKFSNFSFEYCYSILPAGYWSLYFLVLKLLLTDILTWVSSSDLSEGSYLLPFFLFVWSTAG